jgi:hypothetical protein
MNDNVHSIIEALANRRANDERGKLLETLIPTLVKDRDSLTDDIVHMGETMNVDLFSLIAQTHDAFMSEMINVIRLGASVVPYQFLVSEITEEERKDFDNPIPRYWLEVLCTVHGDQRRVATFVYYKESLKGKERQIDESLAAALNKPAERAFEQLKQQGLLLPGTVLFFTGFLAACRSLCSEHIFGDYSQFKVPSSWPQPEYRRTLPLGPEHRLAVYNRDFDDGFLQYHFARDIGDGEAIQVDAYLSTDTLVDLGQYEMGLSNEEKSDG